ncbi:ABC transporter substrate-binding protein [Diaminobutyricimonas sp. LJ205]|uniref:ABC transporter substrate-binding protein n=1 Tax=Diaminobutyricimonas sp. LJ205 TaxID=2683590 RepID=UPI0012F4EFCE|nr:ABC transporter substrate-binding protein [Diaminobutyricimonas sp. LJ205]
MKFFKIGTSLLVGALVVTTLVGCSTASEGTPAQDRHLRIAVEVEPPALNIFGNRSSATTEYQLYNMVEGLVRLSDDGTIEPLLAESYEISPDGTTYKFSLVDATFHDGTPLTADDVKFSIGLHNADQAVPSVFKAEMALVEGVEVIDDKTVSVTLSRPSWGWLTSMAGPAGVIVSEQSYATQEANPVGTGPLKFVEWRRGDSLVLERFDEYWGEKPQVEKVTFKYIADPNAQINALRTGAVDVLDDLTSPELLPTVEGAPNLEVIQGKTAGKIILAVNNAREPFTDVRIREAISFAIDRDALIKSVYGGYGDPIAGYSVTVDPWYVDFTTDYQYDPDRAKQLLADAGYDASTPLTILAPPQSFARKSSEFLANSLNAVGMNVEIQNIEWASWIADVFSGAQDYDMTIGIQTRFGDLYYFGNPGIYYHYDNPEVAALLAEGDAAATIEDRDAAYEEVLRIVTKDVATVPLFEQPALGIINTNKVESFRADNIAFSINLTSAVMK